MLLGLEHRAMGIPAVHFQNAGERRVKEKNQCMPLKHSAQMVRVKVEKEMRAKY